MDSPTMRTMEASSRAEPLFRWHQRACRVSRYRLFAAGDVPGFRKRAMSALYDLRPEMGTGIHLEVLAYYPCTSHGVRVQWAHVGPRSVWNADTDRIEELLALAPCCEDILLAAVKAMTHPAT